MSLLSHLAEQDYITPIRNLPESKHVIDQLTVPTGGGKTLSSLAFALRHALKHDLPHTRSSR